MTETTTLKSSKVISSTTERAQAILAKAKAKEQATAPLINSNAVRTSNKEIIDQAKPKKIKDAIAAATVQDLVEAMDAGETNEKEVIEEFDVDKNAEGVKQHDKKPATKPTKPTKPVAKVKEVKAPMFHCSEAIGIILRTNPKATAEQIINKADTLYIKKTGKESNLFQMAKYYSFAIHFQKGFNSK